MEKVLKYELMWSEVVAMDKIVEDLGDAARRHNSKILYWYVNKLRCSTQSGVLLAFVLNFSTQSFSTQVFQHKVRSNIKSSS